MDVNHVIFIQISVHTDLWLKQSFPYTKQFMKKTHPGKSTYLREVHIRVNHKEFHN